MAFLRREIDQFSAGGPFATSPGAGFASHQRPGVHQRTPGQETDHHPPTDPRASRTDLGGRRHGDAGRQPAASPRAPEGIRTTHAGAGSVRAADSPMEPGSLASPAALPKKPEEWPAMV